MSLLVTNIVVVIILDSRFCTSVSLLILDELFVQMVGNLDNTCHENAYQIQYPRKVTYRTH